MRASIDLHFILLAQPQISIYIYYIYYIGSRHAHSHATCHFRMAACVPTQARSQATCMVRGPTYHVDSAIIYTIIIYRPGPTGVRARKQDADEESYC